MYLKNIIVLGLSEEKQYNGGRLQLEMGKE